MKDKTDYAERLKEDYKKWDTIWKTGWSDPNYPDGEGLYGVRNHIIFDKRELEKEGGELPEEYSRPLPMEMPRDYMAGVKELWYQGIQTYQSYLADENYQYLCQVQESLPKQVRKESYIDNVTGYTKRLCHALKQKDFLTLRLYKYPERYRESFQECRQRINAMMADQIPLEQDREDGQLDLFQMGMKQPEGRHR
mgnify:FL=1